MSKSFISNGIKFKSIQHAVEFVMSLENLRVHASDFLNNENKNIIDMLYAIKNTPPFCLGSNIESLTSADGLTVTVSGQGGWKVAQIEEKDNGPTIGPNLSTIFDLVFTEKFQQEYKGVEITLCETDEAGVKTIVEIVELDNLYSNHGKLKQAQARAVEISDKLNVKRSEIQELVAQERELDAELKAELLIISDLQSKTLNEVLPF